MNKLDLKKKLKEIYRASAKKPKIIEVPEGKFLNIIGRGEPSGPAYQGGLNALYSVAYTLKFKCKGEGKDFTVMPLETQWWWDDPSRTDPPPMEEWNWKSIIRVSDFVSEETIEEVM